MQNTLATSKSTYVGLDRSLAFGQSGRETELFLHHGDRQRYNNSIEKDSMQCCHTIDFGMLANLLWRRFNLVCFRLSSEKDGQEQKIQSLCWKQGAPVRFCLPSSRSRKRKKEQSPRSERSYQNVSRKEKILPDRAYQNGCISLLRASSTDKLAGNSEHYDELCRLGVRQGGERNEIL